MQRREVNPAGEHAAGSAGGPAPDGGNVLGPACLGAEAIDALAGGAPLEGSRKEHVDGCATCRARLDAALEDAKFVKRMRTLAGPSLAPAGAPTISGYRVAGVISEGSQGVVYRAVQERTSRAVAIKVLSAGRNATARQRARAEREAEIVARLRHPNIVTVFESRTLFDGRIAVVMEFIDGVPLDRWTPPGETLQEKRRVMLKAFAAACNGVHTAHLNGVIHRDLKPDNILVTTDGRPVVLDFGIAKAADSLAETMTGEFAGTPAYASPEQVSGRPGTVDALTDVYSMGVLLYRLLTGTLPYNIEGSIFEIAHTISETEARPMRHIDPTISPDLEAIVHRAMSKDKTRRYQSAANLAREVERYLAGDPVEARSGSGWYVLRKAVAVNRTRLAWGAVAGVLVLVAGGVVWRSRARETESAQIAAAQKALAERERIHARAVTELLREAIPDADPRYPDLSSIMGAGFKRLYFRLETGGFAADPAVDQELRRLWANVYTGFGSNKAAGLVEYAEVSLRNGLSRLRELYGNEHVEVAATLHQLAGVMLYRRRPMEAETTCREALALREKLIGPSSPEAIETRSLLARILADREELAAADAEAQRVIELSGNTPSAGNELHLASMYVLRGRLALKRQDYTSAEPLLSNALRVQMALLPLRDPEVTATLVDGARIAANLPESQLGKEFVRCWGGQGIELIRKVQADAKVYRTPTPRELSKEGATHTDAILRYLRLQEQLLGPDDPALVDTCTRLGEAAGAELRPAERLESAQKGEAITRKHSPRNITAILMFQQQASIALLDLGRTAEAAAIAKDSLNQRMSMPVNIRDPLMTALNYRDLAWFQAQDGQFEAAIETAQKSAVLLKDIVGEKHHTVAVAQAIEAHCLMHGGDLGRAQQITATALKNIDGKAATPEDQLAHVKVARGLILFKLDRYSEARELFESAWDAVYKTCGTGHAWRKAMCTAMAEITLAEQDYNAAPLWLSRAAGNMDPPDSGEMSSITGEDVK